MSLNNINVYIQHGLHLITTYNSLHAKVSSNFQFFCLPRDVSGLHNQGEKLYAYDITNNI